MSTSRKEIATDMALSEPTSTPGAVEGQLPPEPQLLGPSESEKSPTGTGAQRLSLVSRTPRADRCRPQNKEPTAGDCRN